MADNIQVTSGTGPLVAADDVGGVLHQRVKISSGADGAAVDNPGALSADGTSSLGVFAGTSLVWDDSGGGVWRLPRAPVSDGRATALSDAAAPMLYNGSSLDRERGNTEGTLLASAARTTDTLSAVQTNYNARGVLLILDVTAASGTGGLQVQVAMGSTILSSQDIYLFSATTLVTTTGRFGYELYPGSSSAGFSLGNASVRERAAGALPRVWSGRVDHFDASSYTYSLIYGLIV